MTYSKFALSTLGLYVGLTVAGVSTSYAADTLWLTNGDKVTGQITLLDSGKLFIKTDYADTLSVSWDKVKTFQTDHAMVIQGHRYEEGVLYPAIKPAETRGIVVQKPLSEGSNQSGTANEGTLALSDINSMIIPKPLVQDLSWKGNIDAGFSHKKSSTTTNNHDVVLSTKLLHGTWRHNLDAGYHMAEEDDVDSTKNVGGEYALDKFIDENWFWQGRYQYKRDWVEEIKISRAIGTGPGYQFWDNDLGAFSVTALVSSQQFVYQEDGQDDFFAGALKWDYSRYFSGKKTQLFTTGEVGRSFDNTTKLYFKAGAGLRYKLTNWSSVSMQVARNRTQSVQGNVNDTLYSLGLGVGW
ncbi:peptide chain release factor RF-3 [Lonsdalea iberica]|uniref:Peptide chain release factor RF-3 n=1 Tax=Lonsdalea iberica TaxID=1082703 RepID=A0A1X3S0C8_9GAMM|nr:DUF481 domain-containing protein [Lonsdalea iberica]OSN07933.1 peptide chain release factor RF-3 [Lonsdalea iberica]OSN11699.1 peptide chain release factor RF-3 [Lonsdalea iberica]